MGYHTASVDSEASTGTARTVETSAQNLLKPRVFVAKQAMRIGAKNVDNDNNDDVLASLFFPEWDTA